MRRVTVPSWTQIFRALLAIRAAIRDHPLPDDAADPHTHFVTAAYETLLHRAPDAAGLAHYRMALASGQQSRWSLVRELLASTEYELSHGGFRTAMETLDA